jgi:hypothetical protein
MQIGNGKQGVKIGEYSDVQDGNGVIGWVQPACDNPKWILWFTKQGDAILYTDREPDGGIKGEPIKVAAR